MLLISIQTIENIEHLLNSLSVMLSAVDKANTKQKTNHYSCLIFTILCWNNQMYWNCFFRYILHSRNTKLNHNKKGNHRAKLSCFTSLAYYTNLFFNLTRFGCQITCLFSARIYIFKKRILVVWFRLINSNSIMNFYYNYDSLFKTW